MRGIAIDIGSPQAGIPLAQDLAGTVLPQWELIGRFHTRPACIAGFRAPIASDICSQLAGFIVRGISRAHVERRDRWAVLGDQAARRMYYVNGIDRVYSLNGN